MKKLISFALSVIIIAMSLFSTTAFAQEQTRYEKWLLNLENKELTYIMQAESSYGDEFEGTVYINNGKVAITYKQPIIPGATMDMNLIIDGNYSYIVFSDLPFFHIKSEVSDTVDGLLGNIISGHSEIKSIKTYTVTGEIHEYYVEEYTYVDDSVEKYYFVGDELYRTEIIVPYEDGSTDIIRTQIYSDKVDYEVFDIPWYSINIYPFLKLFISLL